MDREDCSTQTETETAPDNENDLLADAASELRAMELPTLAEAVERALARAR